MNSQAFQFEDLPPGRRFGEAFLRSPDEPSRCSLIHLHGIHPLNFASSLTGGSTSLVPASVVRGRNTTPALGAPSGHKLASRICGGERPVFAGYCFPHYGHFITETLSRLWLPVSPQQAVILLASGRMSQSITTDNAFAALPAFVQQLLAAAGITCVHLLADPAHLPRGSCLVPWPLFQTRYSIHPEYTRLLSELGTRVKLARFQSGTMAETPSSAKRVYLARNKLRSGLRPLRNEERVMACFEQHGFSIIHPERLAFDDQIAILEQAEIIAGFAGSALHTVAFTSSPRQLICLSCEHTINSNFLLFSSARGDRSQALFLEASRYERGTGKTPEFAITASAVEFTAQYLEQLLPD